MQHIIYGRKFQFEPHDIFWKIFHLPSRNFTVGVKLERDFMVIRKTTIRTYEIRPYL